MNDAKYQQDHDSNGIRVGGWETGLCGCFTDCVPNCLMAWCLPCVSLAQISTRVGLYKFSHVLLAALVAYCTLVACSSVAAMLLGDAVDETVDDYMVTGRYSSTLSPSVESKSGSAHTASVIAVAAGAVYLVIIFHLRAKVRARFQIPGSCCGDFCVSLFCGLCSITQMASHVKSYKPGSCDFGPPDTLPAYQ